MVCPKNAMFCVCRTHRGASLLVDVFIGRSMLRPYYPYEGWKKYKICGHPYHLRHPRAISELRTHKSYHEKGNDKIHHSYPVGDTECHSDQPRRDLLHRRLLTTQGGCTKREEDMPLAHPLLCISLIVRFIPCPRTSRRGSPPSSLRFSAAC